MKMVKTLVVILCALISYSSAGEDSEDFFEVNIRKLDSTSPVKFGARVYADHLNRIPSMMKKIGPVFQLAHWETLWEVSSAAPAPHDADDETMERWIGSIYWNMAGEIEPLENTSRMLVNEGVQCVIAASSPPNSYYNTPKKIKLFRERTQARKEGRVLEEEEWTLEKQLEETAKEDPNEQYQKMMTESVEDFAKFWALSVDRQLQLKVELPLVELTWEPDSKERVYFLPDDYAKAAKLVRQELRKKGIADNKNKILGPGTSSPSAAAPYIEALVKDREAFDAIYAWSIHVWDDGSSMEEIEHELLIFKQIIMANEPFTRTFTDEGIDRCINSADQNIEFILANVPSTWPKKPIIVTSFGYQPKSNHAFDDVRFNGGMDYCYYKIFGRFQKSEDDLPNSMSQSPVTGVRLLANLLLQYSYGFNQVIYEELADQPWSHSCTGMFDRQSRHKQIYVAFSTLLPYLNADSLIIRKQWKNTNECYSAMFKSDSRIVVAIANPNASPCTRSFSLSGIEVETIGQAFTISYNNGTVSLGATDPSEALLLKSPLLYDVFPSEKVDGESEVEFDIVVGPTASATVVIDLTAEKGDEAHKTETNHSEL